MAKYGGKFKLKIVKEYLEGIIGYLLLAKNYGIPAESQIKRWVRAYKEFGSSFTLVVPSLPEGKINSQV